MIRIAAVSLLALALSAPVAAAGDAPKSLYERLGGEAAIRKVVDDFVALAAPDPAVDFTRGGTWQATPAAVEQLKQHLVAFVAQATGGPRNYTGRDMKTAHAGMRITQAQFDALAAHLRSALEKNGVGAAEVGELMKIAGSTAADIVEVK
jgi:hemoglobin